MKELRQISKQIERLINQASRIYCAEVQAISNKYRVRIATGQMSDVYQVKVGEEWLREGIDEHPALKAIARLDAVANKLNIGPTNLENYEPKR